MLRGGTFPIAYAYPKGMRETRDLLRRRMYLVHKRAELLTHVQIVNSQYHLPGFGGKLSRVANRAALKIVERFDDPVSAPPPEFSCCTTGVRCAWKHRLLARRRIKNQA